MTTAGTPLVTPEAFEIPCTDGLSLRGDLYRADNPVGAVIVCHRFKGFARWAFFPHLSLTLAQNGLTAITFDFSHLGIGRHRETFVEPDALEHNTFTRALDDP